VLLGTVKTPVSAYVIKVSPAGGRLEYLFFETSTYRLLRTEEVRDGRRVTLSYSDFRSVGTRSVPYHVHVEDGKPENVRDEVLNKISFDRPSGEALALPTPGPAVVALASPSAALPVKIVDDRVILPLHIGPHVVDMQLDSGAGGIAIDRKVVQALGYKEYGKVTGSTAGDYSSSDVLIPQMTLGALTLTNVHAESLPFEDFADEHTPVAGLIGFDLLDEVVLHIDYEHGTLEAFAPATFTAPPDAVAIPIDLDDNIPLLHATLAKAKDVVFGMDTGADRSVLFSDFADHHESEIPERGLGAAMEAASPFIDEFSGVGGRVEYRPLETGPFTLGPWAFERWLFYVTQQAPTFDIEDYAGLLGQDVLRYYDVYLDYPHQRVYLRPNSRYKNRWG